MRSIFLAKRVGSRRPGAEGQSLVEFALVLTPLFMILLGIIQFGFIFNAYITITNATREGAREGSIYLYTQSLSQGANDAARNTLILTTVKNSMNLLSPTAPHFTTGTTWTQSGDVFTNGDMTVTYVIPTGITANDPRKGETVKVEVRYHQDLMIPIISALLPKDAGGRMILTGQVTMVIN
jgi:Flp pilus assembly protein TadG